MKGKSFRKIAPNQTTHPGEERALALQQALAAAAAPAQSRLDKLRSATSGEKKMEKN
eukprot:m.573947 g.573947  ORF g.573947 m.573947 type:complete len:57 (+) comp57883_c0_seq8:880-1050(+)